jgi:hypothetical protein
VTAVLRLAGAPAVTRLGPTLFAVGAERYLVTFWCTLFVANIAVSVYLHQAWGIAWPWAHRPSLAAAYVLGLGAGLAFVRRRSAAPAP